MTTNFKTELLSCEVVKDGDCIRDEGLCLKLRIAHPIIELRFFHELNAYVNY